MEVWSGWLMDEIRTTGSGIRFATSRLCITFDSGGLGPSVLSISLRKCSIRHLSPSSLLNHAWEGPPKVELHQQEPRLIHPVPQGPRLLHSPPSRSSLPLPPPPPSNQKAKGKREGVDHTCPQPLPMMMMLAKRKEREGGWETGEGKCEVLFASRLSVVDCFGLAT